MPNSFQKKLSTIMQEKNISQSQLSKKTGITQSSLSDYLNDKYEPKLDKIILIAKALKIDPLYLVSTKKDINEATGETIKNLRIKNNLSQEELGLLLGVKRAAVNKWETGRVQNIKKSILIKLAEIFKVQPSMFFTPTEQEQEKIKLTEEPQIIIKIDKKYEFMSDLSKNELNKVKEYVKFIKYTRRKENDKF